MWKIGGISVLFGCFVACIGNDPAFVAPTSPGDDSGTTTDGGGIGTDAANDAIDEELDAPSSNDASDATEDAGAEPQLCSAEVDLCRPSMKDSDSGLSSSTFDPNAWTMFAIPKEPKPNEPFDIFIVTKNRALNEPGLLKNAAICYGGGLLTSCPSVGAGCVGWKVALFRGVTESVGSHAFSVVDPRGPTGCEGGAIASLQVVVKD